MSSGRQTTGAMAAASAGSHAKGEPPSFTGRVCPRVPLVDVFGDSVVVFSVCRIAPQELPRESSTIEVLQDLGIVWRPPIRPLPHTRPPTNASLHGLSHPTFP